MIFKNITILNEKNEIEREKYVVIEADRIVGIGDKEPECIKEHRVYDGKGKLLQAGFFNAHSHSPMTLLRGYGENLNLQAWLNTKIFPFEKFLDGEGVYWATMLAMAESAKFGIVSSTDMYFFCEDIVRAVVDSGMKANIGRAIVSFSDEDISQNIGFQESKSLFETYNGAGNGRIIIDMALHGEYTSTEKAVRQLAEYALKVGARNMVHISETKKEHEECKERNEGKTPVEYLNGLGFFDVPVTAAHCVWITEEDMDILKKKNVTVASCPVSNIKLASGVCNVPKLYEKGIAVAIGTDGVASNNSLNFIEEMKFFALTNKMQQLNPTLISPKDAIESGTFTGAKSQGRLDSGRIKVGNKADLILIDLEQPNMQPCHDIITNVVYSGSGSEIELTMVDGKVIYEKGEYKTMDLEKIIYEVERCKSKIIGELK